MGKIIRFIFLFLMIIAAHETKQKTAHDSYSKNAHAEHTKKHAKHVNVPLFKYSERVKRESELKKIPTTIRDDAEIQYVPSVPRGKNRNNTAKRGERVMPFFLHAL